MNDTIVGLSTAAILLLKMFMFIIMLLGLSKQKEVLNFLSLKFEVNISRIVLLQISFGVEVYVVH